MTRKTVTSRRPTATTPIPRNLWLASLGAVSLARKQGEKIVTALVEEGQAIQARGERFRNGLAKDVRRQVDQASRQVKGFVDPLVRQVAQVAGDIQNGVGERLTDVLGRIGVPNRQDVADLTARVGSLGSKVKARNAKAGARRRPAARRKPAAKRA
jgi:poly(hydroxyalkanoate) granule-associated protein